MGLRDAMLARWQARVAARTTPLATGGGGGTLTVLSEVFIQRSAQAIWDARQSESARQLIGPCIVTIEPVAGTGPGVGRQTSYVHKHGDAVEFVVSEVLDELPPGYQERRTTVAGRSPVLTRMWVEHTGAGCRVREQVAVDLPLTWSPAQRAAHEQVLQRELDDTGLRWQQLLETGHVDPPAQDGHGPI